MAEHCSVFGKRCSCSCSYSDLNVFGFALNECSELAPRLPGLCGVFVFGFVFAERVLCSDGSFSEHVLVFAKRCSATVL